MIDTILDWVDGHGKLALLILALIGAGLFWLLIGAVIADNERFEAFCTSQGGHIITDSDVHTGVGVGSNGSTVVVVSGSTDRYCLSPEGGIIAIQ